MAATIGRDRLFALDVLRGIAACLVLARHLPDGPDPSRGGAEFWVGHVHRIGWIGVDLFFVLSGFLISTLLFKEFARHGNLHLGRFWARRAFKIWPSYFVAYGLMVVASLAGFLWVKDAAGVSETLANVVPNVLFVQNYTPSGVRWPNSWSIAVEEHFYLALPLLLTSVLVWRRRRGQTTREGTFRGLGVFLIGVCCGVLLLRILAVCRGVSPTLLYTQTQFRMDALCSGVLLGYLKYSRPDLFVRLARAWPLLLLLIPPALLLPVLYPLERSLLMVTAGFTILYLAFGALVLLAGAYPDFGSRGPRLLVTPAKGLAFIGVYSYTIYLAHGVFPHLPGFAALRGWLLTQSGLSLPLALWADRVLFWALSIGSGVLLGRVVEQPFLRLRERLCPSRRHNQETPAPQSVIVREPHTAPRRAVASGLPRRPEHAGVASSADLS